MIARNDITGDAIKTGESSDAYRSGWDLIFGRKGDGPNEAKVEPAPEQPNLNAVVSCSPPDEEKIKQDSLRQEWWKYCQENQSSFVEPNPSGNLVPYFEEWRQSTGQ